MSKEVVMIGEGKRRREGVKGEGKRREERRREKRRGVSILQTRL